MLSSSSVSKSLIANHAGPAEALPDSRDGRCVAVEMANLETLTFFGSLEVASVEDQVQKLKATVGLPYLYIFWANQGFSVCW